MFPSNGDASATTWWAGLSSDANVTYRTAAAFQPRMAKLAGDV